MSKEFEEWEDYLLIRNDEVISVSGNTEEPEVFQKWCDGHGKYCWVKMGEELE